jgi:HEAT repeats
VPDKPSRLLADLDSPDENVRARAAVGLKRLNHERALEACLRTIDDAPDPLHADRTPAVQCLIDIGEPALPALVEHLASGDADHRMRAERAIQGISRRRFGFDGYSWPEGAMERWMDWWTAIGFDNSALAAERVEAIGRLRAALQKGSNS